MRNSYLTLPVVLFFTLHATACFAELGGTVNQGAIQIQTQNSVVSTTPTLNVYQSKMPSGTQIREFTNANGIVVAVSWQGPTMPNLKQLLGSYFDACVNRSDSTAANHRNAIMNTDDLVVQSHGQLRAFSGRAYLPKLLPAGLNITQLQ